MLFRSVDVIDTTVRVDYYTGIASSGGFEIVLSALTIKVLTLELDTIKIKTSLDDHYTYGTMLSLSSKPTGVAIDAFSELTAFATKFGITHNSEFLAFNFEAPELTPNVAINHSGWIIPQALFIQNSEVEYVVMPGYTQFARIVNGNQLEILELGQIIQVMVRSSANPAVFDIIEIDTALQSGHAIGWNGSTGMPPYTYSGSTSDLSGLSGYELAGVGNTIGLDFAGLTLDNGTILGSPAHVSNSSDLLVWEIAPASLAYGLVLLNGVNGPYLKFASSPTFVSQNINIVVKLVDSTGVVIDFQTYTIAFS